MKILDKISPRTMPAKRKNCPTCLGRGYLLVIPLNLDMRKFREVRPCDCVKQTVRIEED